MTDSANTPPSTLIRATDIGYREGLHFVYAGNLPGMTGSLENTFCPLCRTVLVERYGFRILKMNFRENSCPNCSRRIPGIWTVRENGNGKSH